MATLNDSDIRVRRTEETSVALRGISVIIPVYNSQDSLPLVVQRLWPALDGYARQCEVILVDDCSRDQSWEVISCLVEQDSRIRGFHLMRNFGQHNALLCGIRAARYEV